MIINLKKGIRQNGFLTPGLEFTICRYLSPDITPLMLLILTNEIKGFEELLDTRERLIRREQYPGRLPHPCRAANRAPARCL